MSRGKGGKGIGANKKARVEAYPWADGEEVAAVTFVNAEDGEVETRILPWGHLDELLAVPLTQLRQRVSNKLATLTITLGEDAREDNDAWFELLTKGDLRPLCKSGVDDDENEDGEDDEGDEDDDGEVDDSDKEDALEKLDVWMIEKLFAWDQVPGKTNVVIAGSVNFFQH